MSTLKIYLVTAVIIALAMVQPVYADGALSLSGGVSLTQSTPPTNMGSQVDAWCGSVIVATWSSTTSKQLKLSEGLLYKAYSQFTGIRNIERIELTPDDGITRWEAKQLVGKGWQVIIPLEKLMRLGSKGGSYGGYGLKWKITSRDKENRLMILFIPITWTSNRASEALNQVVVEQRPYNSSLWCREDFALYLQVHCGFDAVIPLPDLNFEAQRQAINNYRASQPETPVEQPVERPKVRERSDRERPDDDCTKPTPPRKKMEEVDPPAPAPDDSFMERDDQPAPPARPRIVEPQRAATYSASKIELRTSSGKTTIKVPLDQVRGKNTIVFKRGKSTLGTARITGYVNDTVFATLTSGKVSSLRRGDSVSCETWRVK